MTDRPAHGVPKQPGLVRGGFVQYAFITIVLATCPLGGLRGQSLLPDLPPQFNSTAQPSGSVLPLMPIGRTSAQSGRLPPISGKAPEIITIEPRPIHKTLKMVGVIEAGATVPVLAPYAGTLQDMHVEYGAQVTTGDLLAILDTSIIETEHRDALSALIKAKQHMKEIHEWRTGMDVLRAYREDRRAEQQYKENIEKMSEGKTLFDKGLISHDEFRSITDQLESSKDALQDAKSQVTATLEKGNSEAVYLATLDLDNAQSKESDIERKLQGARIFAKATGVILHPPHNDSSSDTSIGSQNLSPGSKIAEGQAMFNIGELSTLKVTAQLSEIDVNTINIGLPVKVYNEAFGKISLNGRVTSIANEAVKSTQSAFPAFSTVISIDNVSEEARKLIRLGMTAKLEIFVYDNPSAIIIPPDIVIESDKGYLVRRINQETGSVEDVPITLGDRLPEGVVVTSGLDIGDRILP